MAESSNPGNPSRFAEAQEHPSPAKTPAARRPAQTVSVHTRSGALLWGRAWKARCERVEAVLLFLECYAEPEDVRAAYRAARIDAQTLKA